MLRCALLLTSLSFSALSLTACGDSFGDPPNPTVINRVAGAGVTTIDGVDYPYEFVERGLSTGPITRYHRYRLPNGTQVECAAAGADACLRASLAHLAQAPQEAPGQVSIGNQGD